MSAEMALARRIPGAYTLTIGFAGRPESDSRASTTGGVGAGARRCAEPAQSPIELCIGGSLTSPFDSSRSLKFWPPSQH